MLVCLLFFSCTENITSVYPELPFNPYDTINHSDDSIPEAPVDSSSLLGVHKYILAVTCAVNGCHDGSFEPDFRTVQSAYNTLVYAPVLKNTSDSSFSYRVIPFDTSASWLWHRLNTSDQVLGKMPLYDTLYPSQLRQIKNWIMNGAPDLFGNSAAQPTYSPAFFGLVAYDVDNGNMRIDTLRGANVTSPFSVIKGTNMQVWFGLVDDLTAPFSFTVNKVYFSTDPFGFSNSVEYPLQQTVAPHFELLFGYQVPFFNYVEVNTGLWQTNDIVYMRVQVQDSDHSFPVLLPDEGSQIYIQTYCSFIVQ